MSDSATKKERIWTAPFIIITVVHFFASLMFYLLITTMTGYAIATYDVPYSIAALTVALCVFGSFLSRFVFANKIDRWGVRKSFILGYGINMVMVFLMLLPLGIIPLLIIRFFQGVAFALQTGPGPVGAALLLPESRRAEGMGYFMMSNAVGTAIGPFVASFLMSINNGSYMPAFIFVAIMSVLAFLLSFLLKVPQTATQKAALERESNPNAKPAKKQGFKIGNYVAFAMVPLAFAMFLMTFSYGGALSFLLTYAEGINLSTAASLFFVAYAITIIVARPPIGRRMDAKGENSVMYLTIAIAVFAYVVLALAQNGIMIILSAVLLGLGHGCTQSSMQTLSVTMADPEDMGKSASTMFMALDLGPGIGPVIWGLIAEASGFRVMYLIAAGMCALAFVAYHLVHGRKIKARQQA